jgi:hypothetical protein
VVKSNFTNVQKEEIGLEEQNRRLFRIVQDVLMENAVKTTTIKELVDRLNKSTTALNKSTERLKATTQTNKRLVKKNLDLESQVRALIAKAEETEDDETGDDEGPHDHQLGELREQYGEDRHAEPEPVKTGCAACGYVGSCMRGSKAVAKLDELRQMEGADDSPSFKALLAENEKVHHMCQEKLTAEAATGGTLAQQMNEQMER